MQPADHPPELGTKKIMKEGLKPEQSNRNKRTKKRCEKNKQREEKSRERTAT